MASDEEDEDEEMMEEEQEDGETAEEEEEGKSKRFDLETLQTNVQDKTISMVAKWADKYVEAADLQEDVEDALNYLWNAQSLFDDLKREDTSQIDDALVQPAEIKTNAFVMYPLPTAGMLPAAFPSMTTAALYDALMEIRQKAVAAWGSLTKPANLPEDATTKEIFNSIVDIIEQVGIAHYEIVRAGLFLHVLLSRLYDAHTLLEFLASKGLVEKQLVRYNSHNPHLALEIEEQELNGVQKLLALIARMIDYLLSAEYYNARRATGVAKTIPATKPAAGSAAGALTAGEGVAIATYTAAINLVQKMPAKTAAEKRIFAIKLAKNGGKGKTTGKQVLAVAATAEATDTGVTGPEAAFVPVSPVAIDMAEARNPLDILNDISTTIAALVEQSMGFISQLKRLARPINFNIYTLQFGSATPLQDNKSMLQKLRKDIATFVLKDLKMSATQQPMLMLKHHIVTQEFAGRYGAGPAVGAVALSPGEEMEDTSESASSIKRITEKSDSIFDAKTSTVKDSLNKNRQNQLTKTNTDTTELTSYLNISKQVDTEESWDVGVSVSADLWDCVSVDVDVDWSTSKSVSEGTEAGTNSTASSTVEQGVINTENMLQEHVEETTANRERTQTTSEKEEEELSSKNKVVRKLKNINRASATTVIFCKLIQVYNSVTSTPGFRAIFANGSVVTETTVDQLQKKIIEAYIKPEAEDLRKAIWVLVKANALVRDYQGRLVNLLGEKDGTPCLLGTTEYFKLLRKQNLREVAEDLAIKPHKTWIKGVVLSTRMYTMPQAATVRRVVVSKPALDPYEKQLLENEVKKSDLEVRLLESQLKDRALLRRIVKGFKGPEDQLRGGFLFLQPPGEIYQKGALGTMVGISNGSIDASNLAKLKAYFQNLKVEM